MGSISRHIMSLVINSLGGGDTHTHKHTHANTHINTCTHIHTYIVYIGAHMHAQNLN